MKILHFEPFFQSREALSSDHVYQYKMENLVLSNSSANSSSSRDKQVIPNEYKRNLMLNLGMVAHHLLTGEAQQQPQDEEEYREMVHRISQEAEQRVSRITKDRAVGHMVGKMMTNNVFELPNFAHVNEVLAARVATITPKRREKGNSNIEI